MTVSILLSSITRRPGLGRPGGLSPGWGLSKGEGLRYFTIPAVLLTVQMVTKMAIKVVANTLVGGMGCDLQQGSEQ